MNADNTLIDRLMLSYQSFNSESIGEIVSLYHDNVVFTDPVTQINGRDALKSYFSAMAEGLNACEFHFEQVVTQPKGDVFHSSLTWVMTFSHPRLSSGASISVPGVSYLQHSNREIFSHRDYYDLGNMLYEHVPVVGAIVRKIRQRLEH
ncbi:nuclear transport factor 2 family protein [Gilvimarinus sp. DA14]|uniref:nuclear transport factor 2 family protein n=1 Tax=Gilvimarinus sp. DA14 TaxID=2956798 RepID=UPI0020B8D254|nr:nuclear transport factor 2 family protein [Gilvimarinus sp. DA14]UTF60708.1 nuclear transport factor 2 family protein [Gilvimarinus sp. DA14]